MSGLLLKVLEPAPRPGTAIGMMSIQDASEIKAGQRVRDLFNLVAMTHYERAPPGSILHEQLQYADLLWPNLEIDKFDLANAAYAKRYEQYEELIEARLQQYDMDVC